MTKDKSATCRGSYVLGSACGHCERCAEERGKQSEAQKILEMIENVDPNDTNTLDEIDARVWCYNKGYAFDGIEKKGSYMKIFYQDNEGSQVVRGFMHNPAPEYTRSRDALKGIRPDGWVYFVSCDGLSNCAAAIIKEIKLTRKSPELPTEELAELHVIIQAVKWDRSNETN